MSTFEIRERINNYIEDKISLQELEEWIVAKMPALIYDPLSVESNLAAAVELCLAEYAEGIRDEERVRQYLRAALLEHRVTVVAIPEFPPEQTLASASAATCEIIVNNFTLAQPVQTFQT